MSWLGHRRPPRSPFLGPMRIPASGFEEIEPFVCDDGKVLKRFRLKDAPWLGIFTEVRMDQMFHCEMKEIKPMEAPKGSIFYMDYKYGKEEK